MRLHRQFTVRRARILLADDLDLTRSVTADYLRSAHHVVTEVPDGEAAIAAAQKQDFDVILTDMRMPVVNGLEVTRRIRVLPGHRGETPVVLVTADLAAREHVASGEDGVDLCLMKPFTRGELLAAVTSAALLGPARDAPSASDPVPSASDPVLDETILGEMREYLSAAAFATQLEAAEHRVCDLLALLEHPDGQADAAVRDAVHDLIGVSGLLGLSALSSRLREFDTAKDRQAPAFALREAVIEAVKALRRQGNALAPG